MILMMDIFPMLNLYVNLIIIFIYCGRNGFIKLKMIILFTKKAKKDFKGEQNLKYLFQLQICNEAFSFS